MRCGGSKINIVSTTPGQVSLLRVTSNVKPSVRDADSTHPGQESAVLAYMMRYLISYAGSEEHQHCFHQHRAAHRNRSCNSPRAKCMSIITTLTKAVPWYLAALSMIRSTERSVQCRVPIGCCLVLTSKFQEHGTDLCDGSGSHVLSSNSAVARIKPGTTIYSTEYVHLVQGNCKSAESSKLVGIFRSTTGGGQAA